MESGLPDSREMGRLGVMHLPRLVARVQQRFQGRGGDDSMEIHLDRLLYDGLGLGLEPAIGFVNDPKIDLERFERWIEECNGGALPAERVALTNRYLEIALAGGDDAAPDFGGEPPPLDAGELASFEENGYVVVKGAVPPAAVEAALAAVWEATGMSPEEPESWYRCHKGFQKIMFPLYHHPALEANRHARRVTRAFQQLWNRERLMATYDRVSVNPPERRDYCFQGPDVHWDTSVEPPMPFFLQGVLYLTDTGEDQGAFSCVPGFHRRVDEWVKGLPEGVSPRSFDFADTLKPIAAAAGDLIIFHHALPHGASPNRADFPRVVQYVNHYPPGWTDLRGWL